MNHTPGPWEARDVSGAGWQIYAKVGEWNNAHCDVVHFTPLHNMSIRATKDGKLVGMIAYESWVQFKSANIEEQWAANAKLCAAAPDLLQAVEFLRNIALDYLPNDAQQHFASQLKQAADAIKKANEGTPVPTSLSMGL